MKRKADCNAGNVADAERIDKTAPTRLSFDLVKEEEEKKSASYIGWCHLFINGTLENITTVLSETPKTWMEVKRELVGLDGYFT